jgi:protein TonB
MKRNNEKIPEFDEIIFENRNKNYGAYDLRKRYKSAASFSVLCASALGAVLIAILSFKPDKSTIPVIPPETIYKFTKPVDQIVVPPPALKPPDAITKTIANLRPVVTDDSSKATSYIPTADDLQKTVQNGNVNDTTKYVEPPEVIIPTEPEPVIIVQEMPEFPGGSTALLKYVAENIIYPPEAQNLNIQGKVILKFVVKSDGSVDRIEVMRGIDPSLDNEAIRVVMTLPRFKPGRQSGIAVPVWFMLPVTFKIENN